MGSELRGMSRAQVQLAGRQTDTTGHPSGRSPHTIQTAFRHGDTQCHLYLQ